MHYVCVENEIIVSILNYRPSVPTSVAVFEITDQEATNIQAQTHYFDLISQTVKPVGGDLAAQKTRELSNAEKREFLNSTDWKVLRHIRQKALGVPTSLTEAEYLALEQHLNVLASVGAQACLPGQLVKLRLDLRAIDQEKKARLWPEAIQSTAELADKIEQFECQLQSVQTTTSCSMNRKSPMRLTQWYKHADAMSCESFDSDSANSPLLRTLNHISLFATDSHELNPVAKESLSEWWFYLEDRYDGNIHIIGHTDSRGTDDYNVQLSSRRATNIANQLIQLGLEPERLIVEAKGESEPRVRETNAFEQQLNRRVEVRIMSYKGEE